MSRNVSTRQHSTQQGRSAGISAVKRPRNESIDDTDFTSSNLDAQQDKRKKTKTSDVQKRPVKQTKSPVSKKNPDTGPLDKFWSKTKDVADVTQDNIQDNLKSAAMDDSEQQEPLPDEDVPPHVTDVQPQMNPTDVNGVQNSSNRSSDAVPNNEKQPADEHANRIPRARGMNTKKGKKYQEKIEDPTQDPNYESRYAMEIRTLNGVTIKKFMENIVTFLKSIEIRFFPEGIFICAIDQGNYLLITTQLAREGFTYYHCPGNYKITVDIATLSAALSGCNQGDRLSFIKVKKNSPNLVIQIESATQRKKTRMTLFGRTTETNRGMKFPRQTIENPMIFKADEFRREIGQMCYWGEMVTIATNSKGEFHMFARGDHGYSYHELQADMDATLEEKEMSSDAPPEQEEETQPVPVNAEFDNRTDRIIHDNPGGMDSLAETINEEYADVPVDARTDIPKDDDEQDRTEGEQDNQDMDDLGIPVFDESYDTGVYILRYFSIILKNSNVANYLEAAVKKKMYFAIRFQLMEYWFLTFLVMECHL